MQRFLLIGILFILLLAPLTQDIPSQPVYAQTENTQVTLFLSYIPSVQFAPMYVAAERGYFDQFGIDIEFEYSFDEASGVDRIALNNLQFGIISGEQVILGRGAEKPLVYVMEWYQQFPVGVVVPADSDIESPEDLRGRAVSLPAFQGASYIGLRAMLESVGLREGDLQLVPIGFSAPEFMCERQVDAATIYIVNEPLTIETCYPVRVFPVSDYATLVANGLVSNEATIANSPDLVRGMVHALTMGIADTIADPEAAFEISLEYVDLPDDQQGTQRQVLLNSVALWEAEVIGETEIEQWEETQRILLEAGLLRAELEDIEAAFTNDFLLPQTSDETEGDMSEAENE